MYKCMCRRVRVCVRVCAPEHMHERVLVRGRGRARGRWHACAWACACVCMCVCVCVCVCVYSMIELVKSIRKEDFCVLLL